MLINRETYRTKVLGCWLGKNIGGTLGEPFEWKRQVNDVSFYTRDLDGEPMPNDDLDIQLLWLIALEEQGVDLDAHMLAEYWALYVTPHWSEYGTAKVNMRSGLVPPLAGSFNNAYKDSCGAFIRSEIWACIAPACPKIAARYAYEDGILDHGNGEGTYGAVFCAALESAAFVVQDVDRLVDIGLSYIPDDCGIARAVRDVVKWYREGKSWLQARDDLLTHYRGCAAHGNPDSVSERDMEKGFFTGQMGWDAPSNVAIVVLGLLYGEGGFGKTVCTAVNCGEDTDCTGATVGALYGIIHGADAIPERWVAPIGRSIKTVTLNLGDLGHFGSRVPGDVDDLTRRTERMALQVLARNGDPVVLAESVSDDGDLDAADLMAGPEREHLFRNPNGPIFRSRFFEVAVDYGAAPTVVSGQTKTIRFTITNIYKPQTNLHLRWYVPEGWTVSPTPTGVVQSMPARMGAPATLEFGLTTETVTQPMNRFALELTADGRPFVMLVPITLVNGDLQPVKADDMGECS